MTYDLMILGGGPAGYNAAEKAGKGGLNVILFEKHFIGGVCLNEGCIPSKALLYSAKILDNAKHGEKYGIITNDIRLDLQTAMERKNKVVKTLVAGIKSRLKTLPVTIAEEAGIITGRNDDGFTVNTASGSFTGKRILIATGSIPVIPGIPGLKEALDNGFALTNREILGLKELPGELTVIGGGIVGLEMASFYQSAGSKVTVIEMLDHIAGNTEREISENLRKNLAKKGILFQLGSRVTEIKGKNILFEITGEKKEIEADKVLVSIGRKPFIEGIGLENIGVEVINGAVKTDENMRTNIPEVYAAGDVNGVSMLAHTAYRESEVCINTILGKKDTMRYHAIPSVIYTNPESAGVGETAETAAAKGIDFEEIKTSMRYSGRYVAENEGGDGICKVILDKKHRTVLGVHMIGNCSSEIIYGAAMMIETEMRVNDIKEIVFPHPTVSEMIRESLFVAR